ncbi:MAG TPA: sugar phosphate isomerase/epimerase family protein [Solirubrobacterales bacterium]|nr:sugar phosphate isomerase/epimerase family protein [Solirubrobacterales bacterium]
MGDVYVGINLEFGRPEGRSFESSTEMAAAMGFTFIEPMVHWGRELLSAAGYFHSVSMLDDPLRMRENIEGHGLRMSAISAHSPLCRPDVSTDYLRQAVRFSAEAGCPIVITDDGPSRPEWASADEHHVLMRYVLEEAVAAAESRGVAIGLETHAEYTATPAAYARTAGLVDSPVIGLNLDTGNSFLSGNDPHVWLEDSIDEVIHVHAKDISREDAERYRGKVRGMLGCACGDGVIDWARIVEICRRASRDLVLSVECGSAADAERSLEHLVSVGAEAGP